MSFLGYLYNETGQHGTPEVLKDKQSLITFIKDHLNAPQLIVTDSSDHQLLLLRDGVDLHNRLGEWGINLSEIYQDMQQARLRAETDQPGESRDERPEWERYYDSIGLSAGEIRMRQRAKKACKAARTLRDVAELLKGTYFIARLVSADGQRTWDYFDPEDFTAEPNTRNREGHWQEAEERIHLSPEKRIRHQSSAEDVHVFLLLDPPGESKTHSPRS
jgi:hypothetical protein